MSHFVSYEWVNAHIDNDQVIIFDCRFLLSDPEYGRRAYMEDHIEGAFYADLEKDLSGPVSEHGGRHPLPDLNILSQFLSRCGVASEKKVVAYDDQSGMNAARFWWLLKYIGHQEVYVMQGNYTNYKENGYKITRNVPHSFEREDDFIPSIDSSLRVDYPEISDLLTDDSYVIIDAREAKRYKGIVEPIDKKAGHIPTSINLPWQQNFTDTGEWLSKEQLQKKYEAIKKSEKKAVVYCGSGVTACVNILALSEAGVEDVKLYPGSWSDWISYSNNPIKKDEE